MVNQTVVWCSNYNTYFPFSVATTLGVSVVAAETLKLAQEHPTLSVVVTDQEAVEAIEKFVGVWYGTWHTPPILSLHLCFYLYHCFYFKLKLYFFFYFHLQLFIFFVSIFISTSIAISMFASYLYLIFTSISIFISTSYFYLYHYLHVYLHFHLHLSLSLPLPLPPPSSPSLPPSSLQLLQES